MAEWLWVSHEAALTAHREQLTEHGGGDGIRDLGLFESAMARPINHANYCDADAGALAACYAFGIARNHPFIDGNKRTSLVVCELFLAKNGLSLDASNAELVALFLDLAAGELTEDELAGWFRERIAAD